jgi:transposase
VFGCVFLRRLEIKGDVESVRTRIREEMRCSCDSVYVRRLHAVLGVCEGASCYEVSRSLGYSARSLHHWVGRFNRSGLDGLRDKPKTGRCSRVDENVRRELSLDLRTTPRAFDYDQNLWDGKMVSHHLRERYGVILEVRQCQRLLHSLGFRLRQPRAVLAKADPEKEKAFKKTGRDQRSGPV